MKKLILGLLILLSASMMFGQTLTLDADSGFYIYMKGFQTKVSEDDYLSYQKYLKQLFITNITMMNLNDMINSRF